MVAAIFEAPLSREQSAQLAKLMRDSDSERPAGVLGAMLLVEGNVSRIVAVWKDRDTLDRYLSHAPVPRGTELMRRVGAEPSVRIVDVLEFR